MMESTHKAIGRWHSAGLGEAISWCRACNERGIPCIMHPLGEYAEDRQAAEEGTRAYEDCISAIHRHGLDASVAIKPSAIGVTLQSEAFHEYLEQILSHAMAKRVPTGIDMEGTPLVHDTIEAALQAAEQGYSFTLTLQAYLRRTPADISRAADEGISVRLVKGAYLGDLHQRDEIVAAFRTQAYLLARRHPQFAVGTQDMDLIRWLQDSIPEARTRITFGFLKGLGTETMLGMANSGWKVHEYLPYGNDHGSYDRRREIYLAALASARIRPLV
ncbi:proline dehydrogenase family protein [Methanogenium sp. S4BF]|uniref:proline dehydrogenase family protein n=1 Tax=Methanogenium sp. S4BF TaxID=1789226 RepID=UPI002415ADDD|nr:proline dehydrogenase family protein [Methanogenium sp. S4BF]WFN33978.1 proline dehydrogenase family protein [Methanogenium sp. S4BF]